MTRPVLALIALAVSCAPAGGTTSPTEQAPPRLAPSVRPARAVAPSAAPAPTCIASFYGEAHRGRPTASGAPFNPDALTAASWHYPFGTRLEVTHADRTVVVTVNDRGPAHYLGRCIDLSRAAFARLADLGAGLIDVHVARVAEGWS